MKEKEEDEENKIRKFAYKHTDNRVNKQSLIQKLRHTPILRGSLGERANLRTTALGCARNYFSQEFRSKFGLN